MGLRSSKQAQGERDVANLDVNEEDAQKVLNDKAAWRKLEYINQAKHAAEMRRGRPPPPFSRNVRLASYFGTGVGLYFLILEWLTIMFACVTILAIPFWVVIDNSVFTVPELKDEPERGVKVFNEELGSDLAQTTFAAIVDSRKDPEGTMRLMLTKLGEKWYGPQDKVDFLLWVSILDIAGVVLMILLLCLFYYLSWRFEEKADAKAMDVTRFAVFAMNLPPDTSAHEVGEYFSRFGDVVDVTLVPDLTYPLSACSKLTCLEQKCGMLSAYLEEGGALAQTLKGKLIDSTHEELLKKLNKINERLDHDTEVKGKRERMKRKQGVKKIRKTADPMAKIEGHSSYRGPAYPATVAIVTFNKRRDQEVCLLLNINAGWSGFLCSLFRVSSEKKIRGYTVRVGRAAHPDDYVYENMAVFWSRPFRFLLTQFVIFILLVACALCVTGMTNWKHFQISKEKWDLGKIETDIAFGLRRADPSSTTCAEVLDSCRSYFVENLEEGRRVDTMVLGDEELLKFTDSRDQQIYRSRVTDTWTSWVRDYDSVDAIPNLEQKHLEAGVPACKPCYCDGLIELENSEAFIKGEDEDAFLTASEDCVVYTGDRGIQGGIATFVAVVVLGINFLLKLVVAVLTDHQKHTTFTSRDRYFALVAYGSQLLNTVLVLLITNARAASQTKNTFQEETARWLQYIMLDGQNDDFGPRWYHQAGYSFMIVLFLHTLLPLIALVAGTLLQGLKRMYVRIKWWPTQADFDVAYDYPLLKLPERVADIMLSVSITLLFSSGMPLTAATLVAILIMSMVVDRVNIYRFMNVVRYSPELPRLILDILPWFIFLHCALGLWMHTYFTIDLPDHKTRSVLLNSHLDLSRFDIADVRLEFGESLRGTNIVSRLGQPNGFGLFLCVILMFLWLVIKICIVDMIARPLYQKIKRKEKLHGLCDDKASVSRMPFWVQWMQKDTLRDDVLSGIGKPEPEGETFLALLRDGLLEGPPSYQIPHVPRYFEPFNGLLYRAVWSKMMGPERYTRLVFGPVNNTLQISSELITSAEQANRKEHEPLKNAVHQKLGHIIASKWEEMLFPPARLLDDSFSEGAASPEGVTPTKAALAAAAPGSPQDKAGTHISVPLPRQHSTTHSDKDAPTTFSPPRFPSNSSDRSPFAAPRLHSNTTDWAQHAQQARAPSGPLRAHVGTLGGIIPAVEGGAAGAAGGGGSRATTPTRERVHAHAHAHTRRHSGEGGSRAATPARERVHAHAHAHARNHSGGGGSRSGTPARERVHAHAHAHARNHSGGGGSRSGTPARERAHAHAHAHVHARSRSQGLPLSHSPLHLHLPHKPHPQHSGSPGQGSGSTHAFAPLHTRLRSAELPPSTGSSGGVGGALARAPSAEVRIDITPVDGARVRRRSSGGGVGPIKLVPTRHRRSSSGGLQ